MASRITIFNKDGGFIGDFRGEAPRSWIVNAYPSPGECNIPVSKYDLKATVKYWQFGNYVLVRHETLPDWAGIIYNRRWSSGYFNVKAIQCEYLLAKRKTSILDIEGTPGAIFTQILEKTSAEDFNEKPIYPNDIYHAPKDVKLKLGSDALTLIQDLANRNGNDFSIEHALDDNGRLSLVGNWYKQRGIFTNKYLREGHNIRLSDGVLEEDARGLVNYLEGRGDASTTGTRLISTAYDEESIATYGLNQEARVFSGNKEQSTVDNNTLNLLLSTKDPLRTYDVNALDVDIDANDISTFAYLDLGNILTLKLNRNGFNGNALGVETLVEIAGMEYDDYSICRLVVEEYNDVTD